MELRKTNNGRQYNLLGGLIQSMRQRDGVQLCSRIQVAHAEPELPVLVESSGLIRRGKGEAYGTALRLLGPVDPALIERDSHHYLGRPVTMIVEVWYDEVFDANATNRIGRNGAYCSVRNEEKIEAARVKLLAKAAECSELSRWQSP